MRVTSFELDQLLRVREARPELKLCWLQPREENIRKAWNREAEPFARALPELRRTAIDRAAAHGISRVGLPAGELEGALVEYARGRGVGVRAWRVPDLDALEAAWRAGALGATVDWPARAAAWLHQAEGALP